MQKEIIISGFGGQGVLFAGQVIAYAAMDSGKQVTWIPSYGPEMRGGTANCTVVIADHEIGSPLVKNPPLVIALNLPSYDKYEPMTQAGGTLVVNQSMVDRGAKRTDINTVFIAANELAALPEVTIETISAALKAHLPARHQHLLPKNYEALRRGFESAKEQMAVAV
jgi:2-oxoglutarate ferredoxin oxidoreductase subunit gamma